MAATDDAGALHGPRAGLWPLIARPRQTWPRMAAAPLTGRQAFIRYALPLAAIPAVAKCAGLLLFGVQIDGVLLKPAPEIAVGSAILTYGLDLVSVLILGFAVHWFSAVFNGESRLGPAMKLAVLSAAPGWFGGIFLVLPSMGVLPPLGALSVAATLYGLYVFYIGLPQVMCVRRDLCPVYAGVAITVFLALWGADSFAVSLFDRATMIPAPGASLHSKAGDIDIGKLAQAGHSLDAAIKDSTGRPPAVTTDQLEALLPADLASGFKRTQVTSSSGHIGKLQGTMAQGTYANQGSTLLGGKSDIVVTVGDLGAVGGLAEAVTLTSNKHTQNGFQKSSQVNGRLTIEKYDRPSNSGEYDVLVADRFLVQAKGRASVETLQAAAEAVPFDRLEALAKG